MTQLEEHQDNAFGDFDEAVVTVTVTDGKLTIGAAPDCYNTKLAFVEVTPVGGSSGSGGTTSSQGLSAASYKYDALGRRLQKTAEGVTTTFVHDGDQVLMMPATDKKRRKLESYPQTNQDTSCEGAGSPRGALSANHGPGLLRSR